MAKLYVKHTANSVGGVYESVGRNKSSYRTFEVRDGIKRGDSVYVLTGPQRPFWVYTDRLLANREFERTRHPVGGPEFRVETETGRKINIPDKTSVKLVHCVVQ